MRSLEIGQGQDTHQHVIIKANTAHINKLEDLAQGLVQARGPI